MQFTKQALLVMRCWRIAMDSNTPTPLAKGLQMELKLQTNISSDKDLSPQRVLY